ncbi:hypothetical protein M4I32_07455 [Microbacterium sp. LRZ72]|uniref:hypothetical protein n=1 Tax=Microbacterium sp. LRZ72 TaxID=2942481 RepID=UPI0029ACA5F1|nr:hypothetical protein [Microbacterium sp. LRZ72]MDX2376635.1 hypothetical protein [Microbacterium sp. LRZ72]
MTDGVGTDPEDDPHDTAVARRRQAQRRGVVSVPPVAVTPAPTASRHRLIESAPGVGESGTRAGRPGTPAARRRPPSGGGALGGGPIVDGAAADRSLRAVARRRLAAVVAGAVGATALLAVAWAALVFAV